MSFGKVLKGAVAAGAFAFVGLGSAMAQAPSACLETQFTSKAGEKYLAAETELIANDNPAGALALINELRALELNCYELGAVLRLGAAVKIENEDYNGAVKDLIEILDRGYVPAAERPQTLYNIYQIYLSTENLPKAIEYANRWIREGGKPTRDNKWTLAVANFQMEDLQASLRWAEEVFKIDGPNADRQVYDFLILLYDRTGNLAKKAQLLEQLLVRNPTDRTLWDAISGDYFRAGDERKAFEVQKAMYLGGILSTEDEIMRVVNFYNRFDAPYEGARILEKEINAGRVSATYERLELLANLYQVAREFEKAIPVIERAAQSGGSKAGQMYERLGRSYAELQDWSKTEDALKKAINAGGLKDTGNVWTLIGQSRFERENRAGACEAFRNAKSRGGRGWLDFIRAEAETARAFEVFTANTRVIEGENEKKACNQLKVLGDALPEGCATVEERLVEARQTVETLQARGPTDGCS